MKISVSYPPIPGIDGTPLLSQNRQYQIFHAPTYVYPVIPAYAATMLKRAGHDVVWMDGIAEERSYEQWLRDVEREAPDVLALETKTPVIKRHWRMIDELKGSLPDMRVVLFGDHPTVLPRESMENSRVDYVLTGGDYDFLLLNLVEHLEGRGELEPGIWFRDKGGIKNTGSFELRHDINMLPFVDRELTKWWLYAEKNGNYKETPGTYLMAGRDCWWHRCSFCAWVCLFPTYRVQRPERVVDEIGMLIEKYRFKEIFDDTGTFPVGRWLRKFCQLMIKRDYASRVKFSCNTKFGRLSREDYRLMKRAGFRMLLFGLESANQRTLDRLNKGFTVDQIVRECRIATEEGLDVHVTIMVGYPWETRDDALRTLGLAKMLMERGWALTLQSTLVIPYPGTPLYEEAMREGWFRIDPKDYDRYDMSEPVLTTADMEPGEVVKICDGIYRIFLSPRYILTHLKRVRSWGDLTYTLRGMNQVLGHIKDFSR
ncbi:MAG: B12-binding domain-containing radical SAM protein [Candidatus Bathyarchaeia archaeon]